MNKGIFMIAFFAAFPINADASEQDVKKFGIGVEAGFFFFQNSAAYEGSAVTVVHELRGSTAGSHFADWAAVPILTQSWYPIKYLQLELKERFWMTVLKAQFSGTPDMNYRLEKDVWPINLDLKFIATTASRRFGGYFGAGPGMYIVDVKEGGFFGDSSGVSVKPGVHVNAGILVGIIPQLCIKADFSYDWFRMDRVNELFGDGGVGGGYTIAIGLEVLL